MAAVRVVSPDGAITTTMSKARFAALEESGWKRLSDVQAAAPRKSARARKSAAAPAATTPAPAGTLSADEVEPEPTGDTPEIKED